MRASVWVTPQRTKDGQEFQAVSIRIERRYMDANGNWQSTSSYKKADLPLLRLVCEKAFEYVSLKEPGSAQEPEEPEGGQSGA